MLIEHLETGRRDHGDGISAEVTAVCDTPLDRVDPVLPCGNPGIGRKTVLEEVQVHTRPQHAVQFGERCRWIRHGAEGECGECPVTCGVVEGQRFAMQGHMFDIHW